MRVSDEIPPGSYKAFTLSNGRQVRVWGNEVIEVLSDRGEWRIVNEKKWPGFASLILRKLLDHWDSIPTTEGP